VTGRDIGRMRVVARAGALVDSAFATVVPHGRLAGWTQTDAQGGNHLVTIDLDGTGARVVASATSAVGVFPSWNPRGDLIAYQTAANGGILPQVLTIDTAGAGLRPLSDGRGEFSMLARFTTGGDLRYLVYDGARYTVWRADADGGNRRQLTTLPELFGYSATGAADFSPDGARLVYVSQPGTMVLVDLPSGAVRRLTVNGASPRWSPNGDRIAYMPNGTGVAVMQADGTGSRQLTSAPMWYGLAWSPDGAYLLGHSSTYGEGLRLVRVSDGTTMPLRLPFDLLEPSWR
jgi:Tol biopolymer transport system component